MGWDFMYGATKKDIVERQVRDQSWEHEGVRYSQRTLAHSVVGNRLWAVFELTKNGVGPRRYICLFLLENGAPRGSKRNEWGYKDITEAMGPMYYDCPLKFLDLAPQPDSDYAADWRRKVREHHNVNKIARKLGPGVEVHLADWMVAKTGQETVVLGVAQGRKGQYLTGVIAGVRYRLTKNNFDLTKPIASPPATGVNHE